MKLTGWFYSIEGEGKKVGLPTFFLEFAGCNSRCDFCQHENHPVLTKSVKQILRLCRQHKTPHIYLDCGEPTLQDGELFELIAALTSEGFKPTLQTNGWKDARPYLIFYGLTIFLYVRPGVTKLDQIPFYGPDHQIKFTIIDKKEYDEAVSIIKKYSPICPVYLFPHPKYHNEKELYEAFMQDYQKEPALLNTRICLLEHLYAGVD
jgi:7-carboxy-7-deazaguanine synthase